MKKWLHSASFRVLALLLAAAVLGCAAAAGAASASSPFSSVLSVLFTPLRQVSASLSESLSAYSGYFVSADYYRQRSQELENELASLRADMVDYEQIKQKLTTYEQFLEVKEQNPDYTFAPGAVIARDSADLYYSFVLDCGSNDGVSVNDPVIFGSYLAGVVKEVRPSSCVVKTFLDPSVHVSAYEVRSREEGIVSGETALAADGLCRLSGLSRDTAVAEGGIVCTAGVGGVYPRDLILGSVREVVDETTDVSTYAVLEPGIDFHELTDAFVLIDFAGKGE